MKSFDKYYCKIEEMIEIKPGIFDMMIIAPEIAGNAKAGQFVHVYVPGHTLRRPISICQTNGDKLRLVFQVRGQGTVILSKCRAGDTLDVLGPLGKPFPLFPEKKKVLLVGGGIGVPPLLGLAEYYKSSASAFLGFRSDENVILENDFAGVGAELQITTEDGSYGEKGYVSKLFEARDDFDCIYACGPAPMLKSLCAYAEKKNIPCYISLEERMACGVGACLGCACGLIDENGQDYYGHVCKDGPVFNFKQVREFAGEAKSV